MCSGRYHLTSRVGGAIGRLGFTSSYLAQQKHIESGSARGTVHVVRPKYFRQPLTGRKGFALDKRPRNECTRPLHYGAPERTPWRPCQADLFDIYTVIIGSTKSGAEQSSLKWVFRVLKVLRKASLALSPWPFVQGFLQHQVESPDLKGGRVAV
jgi:hypothetical protein